MAQSKQNIFKIQLKPFRILLFRPKSKRNIAKHLNFRISGQYILQTLQVKYLRLTMNEHFDWDLWFSKIKKKLNHGYGLLAKIRHFTPKFSLKTLISLFNSNLIYGCEIWGQYQKEKFKTEKLQEKTIKIINFLPLNAPAEKQMHETNILKPKDFIHRCSNHSNLEMEAECLTKKHLILELKYLQDKKW